MGHGAKVVPTGSPSHLHPEHGKLTKQADEDKEVDTLTGYLELKVGIHQIELDKQEDFIFGVKVNVPSWTDGVANSWRGRVESFEVDDKAGWPVCLVHEPSLIATLGRAVPAADYLLG